MNELLKIDEELARTDPEKLLKQKENAMAEAVQNLDFETAALIRDELFALEKKLGVTTKKIKKGR